MGMFKVCSFNVNSIKARINLVIKWLEKREKDIDVLCLQELKVRDEIFPFQAFEELGYKCAVFGQKAYNGVAICAKEEMEEMRKGFGDEYWDQQKRVIAVKIKDVKIVNVYAPHGDVRGEEKYFYKLKFYEKLLEYLDTHYRPDSPLIVVGDMNVARDDIDVYDPELLKDTIGTMPEEREAFYKLLDWGLIDAFRLLYPDKRQFTWWDYIGGKIWKDEGMRIDYILITPPLKDKLKNVFVDLWPRRRRRPKPSDHAPLIAEFEL
jgi:exodeoxyribonuclease-3